MRSSFHCCYASAASSNVTAEAMSGSWCFQQKARTPEYADGSGFVCRDTESACDNYRDEVDTANYTLGDCTFAQ